MSGFTDLEGFVAFSMFFHSAGCGDRGRRRNIPVGPRPCESQLCSAKYATVGGLATGRVQQCQ